MHGEESEFRDRLTEHLIPLRSVVDCICFIIVIFIVGAATAATAESVDCTGIFKSSCRPLAVVVGKASSWSDQKLAVHRHSQSIS